MKQVQTANVSSKKFGRKFANNISEVKIFIADLHFFVREAK